MRERKAVWDLKGGRGGAQHQLLRERVTGAPIAHGRTVLPELPVTNKSLGQLGWCLKAW
jgi:hypothetical protein